MNLVAASEITTAIRKWKPYPAYKESDVEWLGEFPAHWEVAPVYARYEVALGKMLDAKRVTGQFPGRYVRNLDVQWDNVNTEGLPEMDFAPWERERYLLRSGDLLVCEGGEVGRTAMWRGELEECFYQKAIHRVRPRLDQEAPRFFYYLMYSLAKRGVFVAGGNPNTIDHLTAVQLRHYRFPLPPASEQRAIMAFLDRETGKIDALVAKKERLIELLQEKRAALITHAVTKGLDPNVPMKDSVVEWLDEIPAHWKVKRIKHLAKILRGKFSHRPRNDPTLYDGPYPFIQTGDIASANKYVREYQQTLNEAGYAVSKEFPDGTLVMAIAANIGDLAILGFRACFPDSIVGFVPEPGVKLEYLFYNLTAMRPEMLAAATLNTQMNLNIDRIGSLFTVQPPEVEQEAIVAFIDYETSEIDALISKIREGIEKLKEYRIAIISAAVTGKIDVREELVA